MGRRSFWRLDAILLFCDQTVRIAAKDDRRLVVYRTIAASLSHRSAITVDGTDILPRTLFVLGHVNGGGSEDFLRDGAVDPLLAGIRGTGECLRIGPTRCIQFKAEAQQLRISASDPTILIFATAETNTRRP